nr:outer membrane beta-barrel protein [Pedobacter sp. ASV19]
MKRIVFAALLVSGFTSVLSSKVIAQQDTTAKKKNKFEITHGIGISIESNSNKTDSTGKKSAAKGRFIGGITLTRIDWGFSRLVDNGSFTLSPKNDFLSYRGAKTSTFSFDVIQFGYRFNPNFKVYLAGGFDWTLIRLRKDITIQRGGTDLTYIEDNIHYSKNRFSNSYVHIPLNFEFRTKEDRDGKRFYFVVGPEVSFLLNGKMKQISDENGKVKTRDDYHFQPFRYGGTARIGYGWIGLFTKYYFNDMFDSPAQKGLKNMSFGITIGLN